MRPGRYNDVIYAEAMQLAAELYDFKTCVYPGGSAYGISAEKQCRKAPEGEKTESKAGASSTGAGTAHELAVVKALGGSLGSEGEKKLSENIARGGASAEKAVEIAKQNAADLKAELKSRGMTKIDDVIWTAQLRGDGLAKAAGVPGLNEKNNQSDILIKGTMKDGEKMVFGVSLKVATSGSTKYPNDIPFFNGGLTKETKRFGAEGAAESAKNATGKALKELGVKSSTAAKAKAEIRSTPGMKSQADAKGKQILSQARNDMIKAMEKQNPQQMRELLGTMTGAPTGAGQGLQTLKLTGYATGSQTTKIEDAVNGRVPTAIKGAKDFKFEPSGANGIKVVADGTPVMKIRTKWESQALASSIKISGESP